MNFLNFDLNLLRVFDQVMSERSLTKAARNLSLTQPAVSNAMRRLRDILGDDLLRREGQGLQPTPCAIQLWPQVQSALQQLQMALSLDAAAFDATTSHVNFVLAMADSTATELIPRLLHIVQTQAPNVNLRVVPLLTRDPRLMLEQRTADIAIGHFPAVLTSLTANVQAGILGAAVAFGQQRLYQSEYVCVMRKNHPLAVKLNNSNSNSNSLNLDDFCQANHMLMSFSGRAFGFVDEALVALGKRRRIAVTVNQFFTAARVVVQSDLLTVLPLHFVALTGMQDDLFICALPMELPAVHVDALWHHSQEYNRAHQWLRRQLAASFSDAKLGKNNA